MKHDRMAVMGAGLLLLYGMAVNVYDVFANHPIDGPAEFKSPTEYKGKGGEYRWDVKTDAEVPPNHTYNEVIPSEMAEWPEPKGKITSKTPRSGKEKEWYELTGRVVLAKLEADGDLHIQLTDQNGKSKLQVVVEIPAGEPWDELRTEVFSWTNTKFPFKVESSKLLHLKYTPLIRVVGKAFFDGQHRIKDGPTNRRKEANVCVWELHPIHLLTVINKE